MANTGTAQITPAINYFYVRKMLIKARPKLLHTKYGQVQDIPRGNGKSIRFRRYDLLSAATTPLVEGVTPTGSQLSVTNISGTVLFYGDYIQLTDEVVLTTYDPLLTEQSDILGQQGGNTLDQVCRDVMLAGTTIQYASTAVSRITISAAMKINHNEIKEAVRTLQGNNAMKMTTMIQASDGFNTTPINASFVAIIDESTLYDLKLDANFTSVENYASQKGVMPEEVGSMDDVRFVMTTNAKVFTGLGAGGIDVHGTLILAENYYGISRISGAAMQRIVKPIGSSGASDPLNQIGTDGWKASFIAMRLNENFAVRLEHAVSS